MRGIDRLESRIRPLLELDEDRLITKAEFAEREERLEGERQDWEDELAGVAAELEVRAAMAADIEGTLASLRRLSDVYDELEELSSRALPHPLFVQVSGYHQSVRVYFGDRVQPRSGLV